ncbi:MAG: AtpZ/AtpI family protein [Planctomycetaceae bacterium]|nr:AtpZ/AtpI family protein [Planctomycetaceae bacterium]
MPEENFPFKKDRTEDERDIRAAWAIGFSRAAEISNVGLQFVLPVLAGWWLDQKLETGILCLCVGLFLGMVLSLLTLLHLVKRINEKK